MVSSPPSRLPSASMNATAWTAFVLAILVLIAGSINIWNSTLASSSAVEAPPGVISMFASRKDVLLSVPVTSWPASSTMLARVHLWALSGVIRVDLLGAEASAVLPVAMAFVAAGVGPPPVLGGPGSFV